MKIFKISPEVANFQYFGDTTKGSTSETSSERQCFEQTVQIINIKINKKPSWVFKHEWKHEEKTIPIEWINLCWCYLTKHSLFRLIKFN